MPPSRVQFRFRRIQTDGESYNVEYVDSFLIVIVVKRFSVKFLLVPRIDSF